MRRVLPRDRLADRLPLLGLSLLAVVAAVILYGAGLPIPGIVALAVAFTLAALAKQR